MTNIRSQKDPEIFTIFLFTVLTVLWCLQLLTILSLISSFIPIQVNEFATKLFPHHQAGVRPEREMLLYRVFVISTILLQAAGMFLFRKRIQNPEFRTNIILLIGIEGFWLFLQLFAVFKILLFGDPLWARCILYSAIVLSVLTKIFWPEVKQGIARYSQPVLFDRPGVWVRRGWDVAVPLLITLFIYMPDLHRALARIFVWDQFYHMDIFVMAPGWAYLSGKVLNIDVFSQYSVMIPVVIGRLAEVFGGFSYAGVLSILMWGVIFYYIAAYGLLRGWLRNTLLATFGILLLIKLQMFHTGVTPIVWRYPSTTVIRSLFDLLVLWWILKHTLAPKPKYLWAAMFSLGLSLAWTLDVGIYLALAFYGYLFFLILIPACRSAVFVFPRDIRLLICCAVIPALSALAILFLLQGPTVLTAAFWKAHTESVRLFSNGWFSLPFYDGLRERQFFAFIMGFLIPVFYVWTLVVVAGWCYLKGRASNIFVVVLSIYGLAMYHYFVGRSAVSSYYVVCLPAVFILCFWIRSALQLFAQRTARLISMALVVGALGGLVTNFLFTYYPNVLSLAGMNWKPEEEFYKANADYKFDAGMIQRLTKPEDSVAVLSSFETGILIEAERKPYFYYFPMVVQSHFQTNHFGGINLYTQERLQRVLRQLETAKPQLFFVETKLFKGQIPARYYERYPTLTFFINFLHTQYDVLEQGQHLTALKLKR